MNPLICKHIRLFQHKLSNRNATIVSTIAKHIKAIIFVIQAYKSTEVLNICIDLKLIENRLNIRGKMKNENTKGT